MHLAAAHLVEGREAGIPADQRSPFPCPALHHHGRGKARMVQLAAGDQSGHLAWALSLWKMFRGRTVRLPQLALSVPTAQPLEVVAPDLDVHVAHVENPRQRNDLVLRGQHDADWADGGRKAEHLPLAKALAEAEAPLPVNARPRHRFGEGSG